MIRHIRNPAPPLFENQEIQKLKDLEGFFYQEEMTLRSQKRSRTIEENDALEEEILSILIKEFHNKCTICEQDLSHKDLTANNHRFRPRRFATNMDAVGTGQDHYFWYVYEWENLLLTCQFCDRLRRNFFPVEGPRADAKVPIDVVDEAEKRLIIDPCSDNPEEYFIYRSSGEIFSDSEKGMNTIEIYDLNRPHLVNRREEVYKNFLKPLVNESKEVHGQIAVPSDEVEFAGLKRYILRRAQEVMQEQAAIPKQEDLEAAIDTAATVEPITGTSEDEEHASGFGPSEPTIDRDVEFVELKSIHIRNFKNITDLDIEFPTTSGGLANWSFFLGENGSGKSSILQAITMTLIGEEARKELKLNPTDFLQLGKDLCEVKLETNERIYELKITKHAIEGTKEATSTFVIAYGSTRLMSIYSGIEEQDHSNRIKTGNLFNPTLGLVNAKAWLQNVDEKLFDLIAVVLKELLNLTQSQASKEHEGTIEKIGNEIMFTEVGKPSMALQTLSDGYKTLIALVCDICRSISQVLGAKEANGKSPFDDFEAVHGIVIIDELGTHLHPRWKMRIVSALRNAFKNMRFIVSSHEPLCLRGLKDGEVIVVEYEDGDVSLIENLPDPSKFRVDQLLSSPFFGLHSGVDPKVSETFDRYYRLLRKRDSLTNTEKNELTDLSKEVRQYNMLGNSLREELAYYAVDKILADRKVTGEPSWDELDEHARKAVEKLWKEYDVDL